MPRSAAGGNRVHGSVARLASRQEQRGASYRPLARELVRQAFLLAAREELGLAMRDAWLGDAMPPEGDGATWDVVAPVRWPLVIEIAHGPGSNQTKCGRHEVRDTGWYNYRILTEQEEVLSRTDFVEGLKQAGFQGQPNARNESLAVPAKIQTLLGEINFLSQFEAVRELHRMLHRKGESAALVGALARAYANLGVLTEFHWHPAHKVFKARSLLYCAAADRPRPEVAGGPMASGLRGGPQRAPFVGREHSWRSRRTV